MARLRPPVSRSCTSLVTMERTCGAAFVPVVNYGCRTTGGEHGRSGLVECREGELSPNPCCELVLHCPPFDCLRHSGSFSGRTDGVVYVLFDSLNPPRDGVESRPAVPGPRSENLHRTCCSPVDELRQPFNDQQSPELLCISL